MTSFFNEWVVLFLIIIFCFVIYKSLCGHGHHCCSSPGWGENSLQNCRLSSFHSHNQRWLTALPELLYKVPYLFDYKPISAISRDPKLWTCRLGITRTKNKSKTPGYKPRPIHYYKTELLTTGKPNIFGKNSHWLS